MLDAAQILRQTLQTTRFDDLVQEQSAARETAESGRLMGLELEMMEDPMADLMDSMQTLERVSSDPRPTLDVAFGNKIANG